MYLLSLRPDQEVPFSICVRGLRSVSVCCMVDGSVSERSEGCRLVEPPGLSMVFHLLTFFQHLPNSTRGVLNFSLLFGYKYMPLFRSCAL